MGMLRDLGWVKPAWEKYSEDFSRKMLLTAVNKDRRVAGEAEYARLADASVDEVLATI